MGRSACDIDDDDFDFEEYFASTYRPLSTLPTPPLSSKNSFSSQSTPSVADDGEPLESALLGTSSPCNPPLLVPHWHC
jgi:hypothetical protein